MAEDTKTPPPDAGGAIFSLLNEVGIIAQLSRAQLEQNSPDNLTMPQFAVLNHLSRRGETPSPMTLATAFQVPKTSMTHTLASLEKRGLIEMHPNPEDGRSKLVQITNAGTSSLQRTQAAISGDLLRLADDIGADKLKTALPILQEIRVWMDRDRD